MTVMTPESVQPCHSYMHFPPAINLWLGLSVCRSRIPSVANPLYHNDAIYMHNCSLGREVRQWKDKGCRKEKKQGLRKCKNKKFEGKERSFEKIRFARGYCYPNSVAKSVFFFFFFGREWECCYILI